MSEQADDKLGSLFIHLYFDDDVSAGIVDNLRTRGFDVLSARETDMLRREDREQLLLAVARSNVP
jgi:hypothetical protein